MFGKRNVCSVCSTDSKFIALFIATNEKKPTKTACQIPFRFLYLRRWWWCVFVLNFLSLSVHIRYLLWFLIRIYELYVFSKDNGAKTTTLAHTKSPYCIPCHLPCFTSNCWLRHWYTPNMHTHYIEFRTTRDTNFILFTIFMKEILWPHIKNLVQLWCFITCCSWVCLLRHRAHVCVCVPYPGAICYCDFSHFSIIMHPPSLTSFSVTFYSCVWMSLLRHLSASQQHVSSVPSLLNDVQEKFTSNVSCQTNRKQ